MTQRLLKTQLEANLDIEYFTTLSFEDTILQILPKPQPVYRNGIQGHFPASSRQLPRQGPPRALLS